jgi:hypothetical protein
MIIALAILFLLVLLGGIFVTMVVRNLQRVSRQAKTADALALSLAGIQYASGQFRGSEEGADWRPRPTEALWISPVAPAVSIPLNPPDPTGTIDKNLDGSLDGNELRQLDPDYEWLSDNGTFQRPWVRYRTQGGRFLLRVTYEPSFRPASDSSTGDDEFDASSGLIHIESIGRPGDIDPSDPTLFRSGPGDRVNVFRRVAAFVPVGLVDQLWWITNRTNERGPATLGVPPFRSLSYDPRFGGANNAENVEYPILFHGGILSNVDLQWQGSSAVRVYPARGEGLTIKGRLLLASRGGGPGPRVEIQALDDSGDTPGGTPPQFIIPKDDQDDNPDDDSLIIKVTEGESGTAAFDPIPLYSGGRDARHVVRDERFLRELPGVAAQSARLREAPSLDQVENATGISRWLRLTRDSGGTFQDQEGRMLNAGWFGLTDSTLDPRVRARGLYIDNFGELQYPNDRTAVKDEWLQRGTTDRRRSGWFGDFYIPSVNEENLSHPLTEVLFTSNANGVPVIRVTIAYLDRREMNLAASKSRSRQLYNLINYNPTNGTGTLELIGQTRDFEYPPNGIMFLEGSVRVRGTVGNATTPKQLTLVSGGSIYIEGNVLKGHRASFLGLLAQDFVTLNPTAFTRIRPGDDTVLEADSWDPNSGQPTAYHFAVPQGSDLDFSFTPGEDIQDTLSGPNALLHIKHSAVSEDETSNTEVTLFDNTGTRYDFGSNVPTDTNNTVIPPPTPPVPYPDLPYSGLGNPLYIFKNLLAGDPGVPGSVVGLRDPTTDDPVNWNESRFQTLQGSAANFEYKTFFLRDFNVGRGQDANFRFVVGENISVNSQPYWLSRVAVLPADGPLKIRIQAVMYAYTHSWFVIPPPFFNDNDRDDDPDTRAKIESQAASMVPPKEWRRTRGTFPRNTDHFPFYNEALNIDVEILGAVTENMPAEPAEQAAWISRNWLFDSAYDPSAFPLQNRPVFRPNIRYRFDGDLRRMIRARNTRTGYEEAVWVLRTPAPGNVRTLSQFYGHPAPVSQMNPPREYVETLPILPRLPSSPMVYEGNPL